MTIDEIEKEIDKEIDSMKENFIKAIENGSKIKKKDFYIYLTLQHIEEAINSFIDDCCEGYQNKNNDEGGCKNLFIIAKPLANKLSTIKQNKTLYQDILRCLSTVNVNIGKKNMQLLADMLTDNETFYRGSSSNIRECLIDSEGDATEMFLEREWNDRKIGALKTIVERRKKIKIEVVNEKFKGDVDRLDRVLKKRLKKSC